MLGALAIAVAIARIITGAIRLTGAAAGALRIRIALHALLAVAICGHAHYTCVGALALDIAAHGATGSLAFVRCGIARAARAVRVLDTAHAHRTLGRLAIETKRCIAAAALAAQSTVLVFRAAETHAAVAEQTCGAICVPATLTARRIIGVRYAKWSFRRTRVAKQTTCFSWLLLLCDASTNINIANLPIFAANLPIFTISI
jgi:hypothetical protein